MKTGSKQSYVLTRALAISLSLTALVTLSYAYGGPPDVMFGGALWVEGSYLVVPADASFESFHLWTLPGGS
jgi:hypothetical protein